MVPGSLLDTRQTLSSGPGPDASKQLAVRDGYLSAVSHKDVFVWFLLLFVLACPVAAVFFSLTLVFVANIFLFVQAAFSDSYWCSGVPVLRKMSFCFCCAIQPF